MINNPSAISEKLLTWYDRHHRVFPWRVAPDQRLLGVVPDPYHVWLSEIMLQQTTVQTVRPYFLKFLAQWPNVKALAAANDNDIMKAWAGLGYYSRARNLKKCAELVTSDFNGQFPDNEKTLKTLPGIGDYTAAAITAIGFDTHAAVVDGNIERVVARLERLETPLPAAKVPIKATMHAITPTTRPGDFAQAMMDLGATLCTPKKPTCSLCPLESDCKAAHSDDVERFPLKPPRKVRPVRRGAAYVAITANGSIWLRQRANSGLLAGMSEVPTSDWTARRDGALGIEAAPFKGNWRETGTIKHVFTHFELRLDVYRLDLPVEKPFDGGWWSSQADVFSEALPTVMKKAITAAIDKPSIQQNRQEGTLI